MDPAGNAPRYASKTLIGNWFEDRCDPTYDQKFPKPIMPSAFANRYVTTTNEVGKYNEPKNTFFSSSGNWMKFQKGNFLSTTTQKVYQEPQKQVPPFKLKEPKVNVEEYRKQWTEGNHQFPRTYAGASIMKVEVRGEDIDTIKKKKF